MYVYLQSYAIWTPLKAGMEIRLCFVSMARNVYAFYTLVVVKWEKNGREITVFHDDGSSYDVKLCYCSRLFINHFKMFIEVLSLIVSDMGLVPRLETLKSMLQMLLLKIRSCVLMGMQIL